MTTTNRYGHIEHCERPWGWYEMVFEAAGYKIKRICVHPGRKLSLQKHNHRAEHWVVVMGLARATVGEHVMDLGPGQHVDIGIGVVHRLANLTAGPVEIVELQFGDYLGEDDIVRLEDDYGRVNNTPVTDNEAAGITTIKKSLMVP